LVGSLVLEALDAGALTSPAKAATFSGFMHFVRIFGGVVGVAAMTRFLTVRERLHSNLMGRHVQAGDWLTEERLRMLSAGLFGNSTGTEEAQARATGLLNQQVRAQAYTLASSDAFRLICWVVATYLLLMVLLRPGRISFQDLRKMK
jgi:DHA2 family multidrug resistance protein